MTCAPVALFVYNRPWHTRRAVEALQANAEAAQTSLYIFSDAPQNVAASQAVAEVRSYICSIDGFKSVTIVERETNLGLARSIIDGVTKLCEEWGRVIVLEDDLVTSEHFLAFMNDALTHYENEDVVMQVSGYMFPVSLKLEEDALFLPLTSTWGWATWQRAWQYFDVDGVGYQKLLKDKGLKHTFNLQGRYGYSKMLKSQIQGKTDSWGIRWYLSVFLMKGLVLFPKKTLVHNLGFDGSGVNCVASNIQQLDVDPEFKVASMPQHVVVYELFEIVKQHFITPRLNLRTILNKFRYLLKEFLS